MINRNIMLTVYAKKWWFIILIGLIAGSACSPSKTKVETIPYRTGSWQPDTLGNHRVVLHVTGNEKAVKAEIPWRRRDQYPGDKMMILVDEKTGQQVLNMMPVDIRREYGKIVFEPVTGPGDYYLYYLPYQISGRNYPKVDYPKPVYRIDSSWVSQNHLEVAELTEESWMKLPEAEIVEFQSIDQFNSFYPMEVIATKEETEELLSGFPDSHYLLFPESREFPVRMTGDLPYRWIKKGIQEIFKAEPCINEYFAFQIGLYAVKSPIEDIEILCTSLSNKTGKEMIPAESITCFNKEGINWDGKYFRKKIAVDEGKIQALWFGIDIPDTVSPGTYRGKITIQPHQLPEQTIELELDIQNRTLEDRGDGEPWKHSRLRWLNSQIASGTDIVEPFTPLVRNGNILSCLGRTIILDELGLPEKYLTYFNPAVTRILEIGEEVISHPFTFIIMDKHGEKMSGSSTDLTFQVSEPGLISWQTKSSAGSLEIEYNGKMEFDGYIGYHIVLTAMEETELSNIQLEIPINEEFATYFMGLGHKGGRRSGDYSWKWDQQKNQEGAWIGNVNGGLQFALRGENYARPLNTNFYLSKPLNMPESWYNDGKGGIEIRRNKENIVLVNAYSGPRELEKNQELYFDFSLLLTPFKPLDTKLQWSTRFYHRYNPVDSILATGATVVNVHHANEVNPYINYPFLHQQEMKEYITEAHQKGLKVKIYNTIRELSNHAPELFAIRSLGHEIFSPGPGNGYSWLQEHLVDDYIAAWFVPHLNDAAIINSGMSRWHNYYIEGLDWLARNMEIDGLYIDDVAFDRTTMKRVRKILDRNRDGALIDLHSANQFNVRDGFINSACLYMEHFPYIDRLWFGEYFDKDSPPDFWLVEMSGIPFGLMGEMLQDGGNKYRGMVYGMTSRLPWAGDPRSLWKIWEEFGMEESEMIGYWSPDCPINTDKPTVLATAYVREDGCLVAIGSWAESTEYIHLLVDWDRLGINMENAHVEAPCIKDFQEHQSFSLNGLIPVEPGKGWILKIYEVE